MLITKCFQHDGNRVMRNIDLITENFPQLKPLIEEKLNLYFCPKPDAETANAMASNDYICLFARNT